MALPLLGAILGTGMKGLSALGAGGSGGLGMANAAATGVAGGVGRATGFAKETMSTSKQKAMEQAIISGPVKLTQGTGKLVKGMAGKAGISMGVAGILKQSQLFTGFVGALFQILGAFIDVLIAPLMPIMFKALAWVAKGIPYVQKGMAKLTEWIGIGWHATKKFFGKVFSAIGGFFKDAWQNVKSKDFWLGLLKSAGNFIWKIIKLYINLILLIPKTYWKFIKFVIKQWWNVIKLIGKGIKLGWDWAQDFIGDMVSRLKKTLGNLFDNILIMLMNGLNKSRWFDLSSQIKSTQERIDRRNAETNQTSIKVTLETSNGSKTETETQQGREAHIRQIDRMFMAEEYGFGNFNAMR